MVTSLPSRILNYNVSPSSPTDELLTLGQILSEVGDYMSTVLDREHLSLSRRCATKLKKVVGELKARNSLFSVEGLFDICSQKSGKPDLYNKPDLSSMTVSELYTLYRGWPLRHRQRLAEGREHFTFYYEGRIVRELLRRRPADKNERLKIDYCVATYNNELDNMSFILSLPVSTDDDKTYPDPTKTYSPEELASLISRYRDYRDITGRELLVEYVDLVLDLLKDNPSCPMPELAAELADLRQKDTIRIPAIEIVNND